jgi:multidrug resistance efflux pump
MSDTKTEPVPDQPPSAHGSGAKAPQDPQPEERTAPGKEGETAAGSVKKGASLVALLIALSLVWYLLGDRFTPYTTQARVQAYVVGVAPKVAGVVTQVWVENNQAVEAGQRLFEVDPSQYRIALEKAQSDLESARRQVDAGSAGVASARANLAAALANEVKQEKGYNRLQRLYKEDPGTISLRLLESSRASLDQARAQVAAAQAAIQQAIEQKGGNDDADNAILKSAQSAVAKAELDLGNTVVKASTHGVITDLRADVGLYAAAGSPVLTLVAVNDVWINAEFTENNLGHVAVGTPVEILFDALPGRVFPGQVRSVGLGVSEGQPPPPGNLPTVDNDRDWLRQAQRFPVIVGFDIARQEGLRGRLRVGGQASVMAFTQTDSLLNPLGRAYMRLMSWLSYAY